MVTKPDSVLSHNLTSIEIQLGVMAVHVLSSILTDHSEPAVQFHTLTELISAKEHFGYPIDLTLLLADLRASTRDSLPTVLIDKLNGLLDAKQ